MSKLYTYLLGFVFLAFLAGCQHIPKQEGVSGQSVAPEHWQTNSDIVFPETILWSDFSDPVLQSLLTRALSNNLNIHSVLLALETAQIQLQDVQSRQGIKFDVVGPNIAFSKRDKGGLVESYGLTGRVSYELDFWGRLKNATKSSELAALDTQLNLKIRRISIAAQVVTTYFSIRAQDELLRLQQEQVDILKRQKLLTEVNLKAGAITRLNVDQIDVSIQQQLSRTENAKAARQKSVHSLALLLGAAPQSFSLPLLPFEYLDIPRVNPDSPAIIIAQRPDIERAERGIQLAELSLDTARKAWYPSISLSADASVNAFSLSDLFSGSSLAAGLGGVLSNTLLDNGQRERTVRRGQISVKQAVLNYEKAVLAGLQEVETALIDQAQNLRQIEITRLQEAAQERVTRITQVKYETGAASAFDLITEQRNILNVRQQRVQIWQNGINTSVAQLQVLGIEPN